jgi:hypothetical protein
MAEVLIEISPQGDTTVSVKGVKGAGCKALTESIEKSLGTVTKDTPTAEMRERADVAERVPQR